MDGQGFFQSTVPVFLHYTSQLDRALSRLSDDKSGELATRIAADTFTAGEHFRTAQGFVLRTVFPLIGQPIPALSTDRPELPALRQRIKDLHAILTKLPAAAFDRTPDRTIAHTAGFADLNQGASEFLTLFGIPNFFFHLTMGYATLRHRGIELGKADFDGQHAYPKGFHFSQ